MSSISENSLWYKQKRPVIEDYLATYRQLENKVGSQGFLYRPGFMSEAATMIERGAKFKLSEINYAIVEQMITRELAATGQSYEIAVKEAMIAWELEKTQTLTLLEQELAGLKYSRALSWEDIVRLQAELDLRQIVLISTKADIDEQVETYRQQLVEIDGQSIPYEQALLTAQLATANKKLTIIPYIETILAKEQELLVVEQNNMDLKGALQTEQEKIVPKTEELQAAKTVLAENKQTLVDAKSELATKKESLIDAKDELIAKKETLVEKKMLVVDEIRDNLTDKDNHIAEIETLIDKKELTVAAKDLTIAAQEELQTKRQTLAEMSGDLATAKSETIAEAENTVAKMYDVADAKDDIADEKEITITKMEALQAAVEETTTELITLNAEKEETIVLKEALIPQYEAISAKEEDIAGEETRNIVYQQQVFTANALLLAKQQALVVAQAPLLDAMQEKATKQGEHSMAIGVWAQLQTDLYVIKEAIATLKATEVANESNVLAARELLIEARANLDATRTSLQQVHLSRQAQISTQKAANDSLYAERESLSNTDETDRQVEIIDRENEAADYIYRVQSLADSEIVTDDINAERDDRAWVHYYHRYEIKEKARIATTTQLTSDLVHLLG